ncbi:hypothetical protein PMG71_06575 [Roseofilum sp. BLCC_M154]|uniref:Uncharacterized protein n=1 Tax=Roseofilum acuticapitatum BLCC-M154 TaxID=3022444 RepID=A0ABT7AR89_9CYAN|nr:hypothetical protein [Roseofilum acuticapitatum]MDJ1169087.1 hypothetical protein [Roseofilum acuticapitatum BLCC-M154]
MAIVKSDSGEHQHICGAVSPNGNPYFGEGFNSRKIKEGTYLVEFEKPFGKNPAPICTVFGSEWKTFNMSVAIVDLSPTHFICVTSSPDRPVDCAFTFIAFGDL